MLLLTGCEAELCPISTSSACPSPAKDSAGAVADSAVGGKDGGVAHVAAQSRVSRAF